MLHVIATIQVAPGKRDTFLAEFQKLVPQVRGEDGCLEYGPTVEVPSGLPVQTAPRADVVVVVEKWRDLAALQAHLTAPHLTAFRDRTKELVEDLKLLVLQPA